MRSGKTTAAKKSTAKLQKALSTPKPEAESAIALANQVLAVVKKSKTSSHDIIPSTELPYLMPNQMIEFVDKFGYEKMEQYIKYLQDLHVARDSAKKLTNMYKGQWYSPGYCANVAITQLGLGECQEAANLAVLQLGLLKCKYQVRVCSIASYNVNVRSGGNYNHAFIILGDASRMKAGDPFSAFKSLPDDCVLLDPFLGIVGKANQFNELLKDYIAAFQMEVIQSMDVAELGAIDYQQIQTNVAIFATEMKKMAASPDCVKSPHLEETMSILNEVKEPKQRAIIKLTSAAEKSHADIYASFLAKLAIDNSAAFRIACGNGNAELIRLMIENHDLLDRFALNIPSTTKPNTALDWLQLNKFISAEDKLRLTDILRAAGCMTNAEVEAAKERPQIASKGL